MLITLPDLPPAPWLRLAHVARYGGQPGTTSGLRRLDDWELMLITAGATWVSIAGASGRISLESGAAMLIPPGIVYEWGIDEHVHLAVHFDVHPKRRPTTGAAITYLPGALPRSLVSSVLRQPTTWTLRDAGQSLAVPFIRRGPAVSDWPMRCAPLLRLWAQGGARTAAERLRAAAILGGLLADWLALGATGDNDSGPARVRRLLDRLASDPGPRQIAIVDLARQCGLGEASFRAAVIAITGMNPRRWLEARRVASVTAMLADTRIPIARVATIAGYDDPFHFARIVRRVTGRSPSQHRVP